MPPLNGGVETDMKKYVCFLLIFLFLLAQGVMPGVLANKEENLPANPFKDTASGKWFTEGILWCYKYGYMSGTGDEVFSPDAVLSRAMFVQILYTADLADEKYSKSSFFDVDTGKWYFNAAEWAYKSGYTSGTGNGYFSPDSPVTREQLALFLYNYAKSKGAKLTASSSLSKFSDRAKISSWAKTAVSWAVAEGFLAGTGDNMISPKAGASRAQSAVVISQFLKKYGIQWDDGKIITQRTCKVDGVIEYHALDKSGRTMRVTLKAWHNYGYGKVTKAATCTAAGIKTFTCSVCKSTRTESIKATGHKWDSGKVTKPATCTAAGVKTFTCSV